MSELRTDFKDDILDVTQNEKRKYNVIHNEDGTISLEDATVYLQQGDSFGANELNEMNEVVNEMLGVNERLEGFVTHTTSTVSSEEGVHGFRYFENVFEIKDHEGNFQNVTPVNLKWDISDEVYSESREVSTLPRDISGGYAVKFKDEFYIVGGDTTLGTALPSYKYVDGEWINEGLGAYSISKRLNNRSDFSATGGVVANDNYIYITKYDYNTYANCLGTHYWYNGTSASYSNLYYGTYSSSYVRCGNIAIAATGNVYKTIGFAHANSIYTLTVGSTTKDAYTRVTGTVTFNGHNNSSSKIIQPFCQGVYFKGTPTFLISIRNYGMYYGGSNASTYHNYELRYCLIVLDSNDTLKETIELPCHEILVTDMVCINDYIYVTYYTGDVWRYKNKWEKVNIGNGSLVEHNGEIHRFYGTTHTAHKLYREAKTYAPKGTKIYLQGETLPLSENLLTIDNGYVVTEDGEVKIAIYE